MNSWQLPAPVGWINDIRDMEKAPFEAERDRQLKDGKPLDHRITNLILSLGLLG
jgi:hypothetical protein